MQDLILTDGEKYVMLFQTRFLYLGSFAKRLAFIFIDEEVCEGEMRNVFSWKFPVAGFSGPFAFRNGGNYE